MNMGGAEIATATLLAVPVPVLLVLGDRADEDGVAMQRKRFFAAMIELHRVATGPADDVGNGRRAADLGLAALAFQDRRVARDRRYHHDAHATDLHPARQEIFMGIVARRGMYSRSVPSSKSIRSPPFFEAGVAHPSTGSAKRTLAKYPGFSANRHPGMPREGAEQSLEKAHGSSALRENPGGLFTIDLHPVGRVLATLWILVGPHGHGCLDHCVTVFGVGVVADP